MKSLWRLPVILGLLTILAGPARGEELQVSWVPGPSTVTLGDAIAEVGIGQGFVFANPADTRKIMEYMGNPSTKAEAGLIAPSAEGERWFIVFEYNPIGYVPDTDKDQIDADAILKAISEGTEASNETRKKRGEPGLHVVGWHEPPRYDERTHNLVWALLAKNDDGREIINHNTRLLGRHGYMSTVLVASPDELARARPQVDGILQTFRYSKGKSYAEYVTGDTVAKYGLTALVAGGVGAAAAKFGLFKFIGKFFKVIVLAAIAFFATILKTIKRFFSRADETPRTKIG
jgi:uncharacterized membrane-anchored protein